MNPSFEKGMKFSLIMGTYGRNEVLPIFLESLRKQTYRNFELVVVDQNTDCRTEEICDQYSPHFQIQYIKADKPGLSHARNIGLKHICGDIIAFPDDDCEYPLDLLSSVHHFFINNRDYDILSVSQLDTQTRKKVSWFLSQPCILNEQNMLKAGTSISIFIQIKDNLLNFDEQFGVGSLFGSAEETDYIFRFLQLGRKGYYDPHLGVYHQERNLNNMSLEEAYRYSLGLGAYLKKHMFFGRHWRLLSTCFKLLLIRPVGGMLFSLVKLNWVQFKWYKNRLKGRIRGFLDYNRDSCTVSKSFE